MNVRYVSTEVIENGLPYIDLIHVDFEHNKHHLCVGDVHYIPKELDAEATVHYRTIEAYDFFAYVDRDNKKPILAYNIDKISFDKACELFKEFVKEYNEP